MNIYEKLLKVQMQLEVPKSQYNQFGDFHYRSCEDIQEAVKPLLGEVKAILLTKDEVIQIGSRFYIKATAVFQDTESMDSIENTAYARESEEKPKMDAAQITGSCSSYARKYALNGLFCIDDAKDPDTRGQNQGNARPDRESKQQGRSDRQQKATLGKKELDRLRREASRTGTDLTEVCMRYRVGRIEDLTEEQYRRAMGVFGKMETMPPPILGDQIELDLPLEENLPFR